MQCHVLVAERSRPCACQAVRAWPGRAQGAQPCVIVLTLMHIICGRGRRAPHPSVATQPVKPLVMQFSGVPRPLDGMCDVLSFWTGGSWWCRSGRSWRAGVRRQR